MKKIIFLLLLFSKAILAQESNDKVTYLDSLGVEVSSENKFYTSVVKDYYLEKTEYKFLKYYKNGNLKEERTLSGKDGGFPIGEEIQYYENGNKSVSTFYENKKLNGKSFEWHEDGKIKKEGEYDSDKFETGTHFKTINFWNADGKQTVINGNGNYEYTSKDLYEKGSFKNGYKEGLWTGSNNAANYTFRETYHNGDLVSGESIDADGTKNEYTVLEIKPVPKKGFDHFYKFIQANFIPTDHAYKNKVKGRILIGFVINQEGEIVETKIVRSVGYGLDEVAIKVLNKYENWKPAFQRGRKVRCSYTIPIAFDLSR